VTALKIQHNPFAKAFLDRQKVLGSSSGSNSPFQNQLQHQEFQFADSEARNADQREVDRFSTTMPQEHQQQQRRFHQRYMPYNPHHRIHNKNLQVSGQGDGLILKEEPGGHHWRRSTSSPDPSSALTWDNGCSPSSGAYFCPPLSSTPLGKKSSYFIFSS